MRLLFGLGEREWLVKEERWLILVGLEALESEKLERLLSSEIGLTLSPNWRPFEFLFALLFPEEEEEGS